LSERFRRWHVTGGLPSGAGVSRSGLPGGLRQDSIGGGGKGFGRNSGDCGLGLSFRFRLRFGWFGRRLLGGLEYAVGKFDDMSLMHQPMQIGNDGGLFGRRLGSSECSSTNLFSSFRSRCQRLDRRLNWNRRAAVPESVCDSTFFTMLSLCVSRKCFSTSSIELRRTGSGRFRQMYSVFQLWSSTHFFTTASSRTIFTRAL